MRGLLCIFYPSPHSSPAPCVPGLPQVELTEDGEWDEEWDGDHGAAKSGSSGSLGSGGSDKVRACVLLTYLRSAPHALHNQA